MLPGGHHCEEKLDMTAGYGREMIQAQKRQKEPIGSRALAGKEPCLEGAQETVG